MNEPAPPVDQIESAILGYYEECQIPFTNQRTAILDAWETQPAVVRADHFRWGRRLVATVVALLFAALSVSVWEARSGPLYGADDLPERLLKVNHFHLAGWLIVEAPIDSGKEDTRLRVEFLVQRPGRFRHTFHGISEDGKEQTIISGTRLCDGLTETTIQQGMDGYFQVPVHALDAVLKTEQIAQQLVFAMVLGPPDLSFQSQGNAFVKGIPCDLYVGSLGDDARIEMWINPRTGWPERVVHSRKGRKNEWVTAMEIDEVIINGTLPENAFAFVPPDGAVDLMAKQRPPSSPGKLPTPDQPAAALTIQATSSSHSRDQSLGIWHGFRLSPDSVMVIWKRTAPTPDGNGALDWLQGIKLEYRAGGSIRELNHEWVAPPDSGEWLWSILKATDGEPLGLGHIAIHFRGERFRFRQDVLPLEFSEETLEQLVLEAGRQIWKGTPPAPSLKSLREQAAQLRTTGQAKDR